MNDSKKNYNITHSYYSTGLYVKKRGYYGKFLLSTRGMCVTTVSFNCVIIEIR